MASEFAAPTGERVGARAHDGADDNRLGVALDQLLWAAVEGGDCFTEKGRPVTSIALLSPSKRRALKVPSHSTKRLAGRSCRAAAS